MTPRKHAELIKAWADGAEIEWRIDEDDDWAVSVIPVFNDEFEYRIKPAKKVIRYRRYVWSEYGELVVQSLPCFCAYKSPQSIELLPEFIRWIDAEWQEVEV